MKDIKITKIERLKTVRVPYAVVHKYLLHRDDNGTPFHIGINHVDYQDSRENIKFQIQQKIGGLDVSLKNNYGRITNLWDVIYELQDLENI